MTLFTLSGKYDKIIFIILTFRLFVNRISLACVVLWYLVRKLILILSKGARQPESLMDLQFAIACTYAGLGCLGILISILLLLAVAWSDKES